MLIADSFWLTAVSWEPLSMLLALDVGNTNVKLGLYRLDMPAPSARTPGAALAHERADLAAHWRLTTHRAQTVDEYGVLFVNLFERNGHSAKEVTEIIISSVVPPVDATLRQVCESYFHIEPLFVEPGMKTGIQLLIDNPTELGADRLADSVAAFAKYGGPCIVVNFGTATRFEVVGERGEYLGGAISPGLGISADALFSRAAKLGRIEIKRPPKVIGTNTVTHLQTGLYYGYIGLVDGILDRILQEMGGAEMGAQPRVIATGGLAQLVSPDSRYIKEIDDLLTLDGLRILFERNRAPRPRGRAH
jgi:type III pantothenate kinase